MVRKRKRNDERRTEAKWRNATGGEERCAAGGLRGTRSENTVPCILSRRLHLYLSPIRLYGIYPPYSPRNPALRASARKKRGGERERERERERE